MSADTTQAGLDLAAIRARVAATSSDQWELVTTSTLYMNGQAGFTVRMGGQPGIKATITAFPSDAELMVAARQDIPTLLALMDEHAETLERLHAGYNERLNALAAGLGQYRRAVAEVRAIHFQYLTAWTDEYTCAGCNRGMELVLWPCDTIKAIEEAVKP